MHQINKMAILTALAGMLMSASSAMAQTGPGKISTIGYWCEQFGGDWTGSRCMPPGNNAASNLLPAMNNVTSRSSTAWMLFDVQGAGSDYLKIVYGPRNISFATFTPAQLQANSWRLQEPELATRIAFVYKTNVNNPAYLGLVQNHGFAPEILTSGLSTTPVHGGAIPLKVPARCQSFPSCIQMPEQDPNYYKGRAGNAAFSPASNPHWTHDPIPDTCNPYNPAFIPPFVVNGLVFAELRNDLRYLSNSNLQALLAKGYDFAPLYARDFGTAWMDDNSIIRINPNATRKQGPGGAKTESYYQNLIQTQLIVPNPAYVAAKCRLHLQRFQPGKRR